MDVVISAFQGGMTHVPHEVWEHGMDVLASNRPFHDIGTGKMMSENVRSWFHLSIMGKPRGNPNLSERGRNRR